MSTSSPASLLQNKNAVIHGGAGAIGAAVARAFARDGARVFLAGRTLARLEAVAADIRAAGGRAEVASVDALDAAAVGAHAEAVVGRAGSIDVVLNAVGVRHVQGPPMAELSLDDFFWPVEAYVRSTFIIAKAVARHMVRRGAGVIFTLSTPGSRLPGPGYMGLGVACAAVEALTRHLAGELGASGIRAICLRPDAIPEALAHGSHSREAFQDASARAGISIDEMLGQHARTSTLLRRLPTLAEVANVAAFLASDRASAMTGTVANLTCGSLVD